MFLDDQTHGPEAAQKVLAQHKDFFDLLKIITLRRRPNATHAERPDLLEASRFLALTKTQIEIIDGDCGKQSATEQEFAALIARRTSPRKIMLDPQITHVVARLLGSGELKLRHPGVVARRKARQIYDIVFRAASAIPGQQEAAHSLAADLAAQLSNSKPTVTARALIHGEQAWGTHEMMAAVASALAERLGYRILEIDCSVYRSEGEAASWTGSKSYWAGSAPGEITEFIRENPKTIVCFKHMDQTHPAVLSTLLPALDHGELTDQYGFSSTPLQKEIFGSKTEQTNVVDCRQALFLCEISHGSHWLEHPNAETILGQDAAQQKANLLGEVGTATREHRGEQIQLVNTTVLARLEPHHHLLRPIGWKVLRQQCRTSLPQALRQARDEPGLSICIEDENVEQIADLALLRHGAQMSLADAAPEGIYSTLLAPIFARHLSVADEVEAPISLRLDSAGSEALRGIMDELGSDPIRSLYRKNQFVNFTLAWGMQEVLVREVRLQAVRHLSDYTGASGLVSQVPSETLNDVAGQDKAKTFMREMVGYLQNLKALKQYGVQPPCGAVLHGPPGTGKTLIARALAGEAGMPFISVTGSQMLDLQFMARVYAIAHRCEPCVIHIDEADVLGKRGAHSHTHDAAVNFLLAKIDGFERHPGVFHILTTNRPDELDPALTRPGRIDRSFAILPLNVQGREQFLQRLWPLLDAHGQSETVRGRMVKQCYGMTGAELAKLHREIALRLVREGITHAPAQWVSEEISRIQYGDAHERHADDAFRRRVAVHEAGHALLHHLLLPAVPIAQVSITPRNKLAGFLACNGEGADTVETPSTVRAYITALLAGRAAEIMVFGVEGPGTGAAVDLQQATEAAMKAVAFAGLDHEFGCISLAGLPVSGQYPAKLHEAAILRVRHWVEQAAQDALATLKRHRPHFTALLDALLAKETLDGAEVAEILDGAIHTADEHDEIPALNLPVIPPARSAGAGLVH